MAELQELSKAFVKAYDGSVLVTVVATDVAHTRRTIRAAPQSQEVRKFTLLYIMIPNFHICIFLPEA